MMKSYYQLYTSLNGINIPNQISIYLDKLYESPNLIWDIELPATIDLIDIALQLNLINKEKYQLIYKEAQQLIHHPRSQVHMWNKIHSMVIQKKMHFV